MWGFFDTIFFDYRMPSAGALGADAGDMRNHPTDRTASLASGGASSLSNAGFVAHPLRGDVAPCNSDNTTETTREDHAVD